MKSIYETAGGTNRRHGDHELPRLKLTVILNFVTFISDTCLHFGQNRGKFFNSVLYLICTLVLFPQTGQRINCTSCMS